MTSNQHIANPRLTVIHLLFTFAQASQPVSEQVLARLLRMPVKQVQAILLELDRLKMVDAHRLRLTMEGLVVAAATRSRFRSPMVAPVDTDMAA